MHVMTMSLFSAMVQGRCILNAEFLLEHADYFGFKYDLLLAAIENTKLPKFYRRYLIDIIHHLFVDHEPHMQVKFKDRVVMSKQNADQYNLMQRRKSGAHEVNDRFFKYPQLKPTGNHARLKGILVKTLTSNGCFKTYGSDGSLLLMSCLTTMNVLLQFGM